MNSQQRHFSHSSYSCHSHQHQGSQSPAPTLIKEYINLGSDKAKQALVNHCHREWNNNRRFHESYKTVMCQNWLERAYCNYGRNCRYAHGFDDLRQSSVPLPINDKYKTRLCDKYTRSGICPYGSRCLFIHPEVGGSNGNMSPSPRFSSMSPLHSALPLTNRSQWMPPPSPLNAITPKPGPLPLASINTTNNNLFTSSLPASLLVTKGNNSQTTVQHQPRPKSRNLFPQIQEELHREREMCPSSSTATTPGCSKWMDHEMERLVNSLIASPNISREPSE